MTENLTEKKQKRESDRESYRESDRESYRGSHRGLETIDRLMLYLTTRLLDTLFEIILKITTCRAWDWSRQLICF